MAMGDREKRRYIRSYYPLDTAKSMLSLLLTSNQRILLYNNLVFNRHAINSHDRLMYQDIDQSKYFE